MSQSAEKAHMNLAEYKLKFLHSYFFVLLLSYLLGIFLVYPKYGLLSIGLQLSALNFYVYGIHRLSHSMPSIFVNYHMYSHHNKKLGLPRPLELACEFLCDFSWFLLLMAAQYLLKLDILSNTLILFIGLWYSSVHVLNLSLGDSKEHRIHHTENEYNYGPPYIDILFGTLKTEVNSDENDKIKNGVIIFFFLKLLQTQTKLLS